MTVKIRNKPLSLRLPWPKGASLLCTAGYGPAQGSSYHDDKHNAFYALDFDKPWRGNIMPVIPILAAASGKISKVGKNKKDIFGYHIILDHGNGYQTLYAHLKDKPKIFGQVKQGEVLGYLGESGQSVGPHLHFQMFYRGRCIESIYQSRPEPISGYKNIRRGIWYCSNNTMKGGKQ